MTETELLVDCLRRLETAGIEYMLVGSMAGNFWGVPRSTHDIDFVIDYDKTQVDAIVEAFQDDFFIQQISVASGLRPAETRLLLYSPNSAMRLVVKSPSTDECGTIALPSDQVELARRSESIHRGSSQTIEPEIARSSQAASTGPEAVRGRARRRRKQR